MPHPLAVAIEGLLRDKAMSCCKRQKCEIRQRHQFAEDVCRIGFAAAFDGDMRLQGCRCAQDAVFPCQHGKEDLSFRLSKRDGEQRRGIDRDHRGRPDSS